MFICVHLWLPLRLIAQEPAPGIKWRTFEEAATESIAAERVMVIYFTADWCGWCRKMEAATLADPRVIELAPAFAWTKVDIDARPEIAARFGVRGVPTTVLFNARGELLASRPGYAPPDDFLDLLTRNRDKAAAPGWLDAQLAERADAQAAILDAQTDEALRAAVTAALTNLAEDGPRPHEPLVQAVLSTGRRAWPALVDALASERLATRAAAAGLLRQAAPDAPAFDPFADAAVRDGQVRRWRAWLVERPEPQVAGESSGS